MAGPVRLRLGSAACSSCSRPVGKMPRAYPARLHSVSATALRRPPLASLTQPPPLSYQSKRGGPNRSALCSLLRRTFQNLRHFTHRRLHVPLPLPSSRAFEKDSTQWTAGPSAGGLSCHGDRAAARAPLAETDRACPASIPPSPAWGQVAFQLTPVNNGSGTSVS